jgi:hypothetical protein
MSSEIYSYLFQIPPITLSKIVFKTVKKCKEEGTGGHNLNCEFRRQFWSASTVTYLKGFTSLTCSWHEDGRCGLFRLFVGGHSPNNHSQLVCHKRRLVFSVTTGISQSIVIVIPWRQFLHRVASIGPIQIHLYWVFICKRINLSKWASHCCTYGNMSLIGR